MSLLLFQYRTSVLYRAEPSCPSMLHALTSEVVEASNLLEDGCRTHLIIGN